MKRKGVRKERQGLGWRNSEKMREGRRERG